MLFFRALIAHRYSATALLVCGVLSSIVGAVVGAKFLSGVVVANPAATAKLDLLAPTIHPNGASYTTAETPAEIAPSQIEARAKGLAEIAESEPERAIALACAESNSYIRQLLLSAVLRKWGSIEPNTAANWSLQRPLSERSTDISAILEGIAHNPAAARQLTTRLIQADPPLAHDYGCSLVYAFSRVGNFSDAAAFATQRGNADEHRDAWIATAFTIWTEQQPQAAASAALILENTSDQQTAVKAVSDRWAALDPRGLAEFAVTVPSRANRSYALSAALYTWANQDLSAASTWLNKFEPSPDLDACVAAVATRPLLITHRPEIAVNWAESMFNPDVRSQALTAIIVEWAKTNHAAAQNYARTSTFVTAADRTTLLEILTPTAMQ